MPSYESLVQAAQQDDQAAFDELVVRFQAAAREWAFQALGDTHLAEDAVQEAFLLAYRQIHQLREPTAFPAWLRRIVVSQCHRITRRRTLITPLDEDTSADDEHDPAEAVENRELVDTLRRAVQGLPAGERAVTELFYITGYSQQEIARQLELPLTTVKKRLQYARERLKETMSPQIVASLHLDDDPDPFTGLHPMASVPFVPVLGYTAAYSWNDDDPSAADEMNELISYLQQQQLIPVLD